MVTDASPIVPTVFADMRRGFPYRLANEFRAHAATLLLVRLLLTRLYPHARLVVEKSVTVLSPVILCCINGLLSPVSDSTPVLTAGKLSLSTRPLLGSNMLQKKFVLTVGLKLNRTLGHSLRSVLVRRRVDAR